MLEFEWHQHFFHLSYRKYRSVNTLHFPPEHRGKCDEFLWAQHYVTNGQFLFIFWQCSTTTNFLKFLWLYLWINNTFFEKKSTASTKFYYKMDAQNFQNAIIRRKMLKFLKKCLGFFRPPKIYIKHTKLLSTLGEKRKNREENTYLGLSCQKYLRQGYKIFFENFSHHCCPSGLKVVEICF